MANNNGSRGFTPFEIVVVVLAVIVIGLAGWAWYVASSANQQPAAEEAAPTYSMAEVAERDSEDECWLVIDGIVYDATDYLAQHPPGAEPILRNCGADASAGFANVRAHGDEAKAVLAGYEIGTLAE